MIAGKNWKYHLLFFGDIIEKDDEFYNPEHDRWQPVDDGEPANDEEDNVIYPDAVIGFPWNAEEHKPMRRKNPDYKPV